MNLHNRLSDKLARYQGLASILLGLSLFFVCLQLKEDSAYLGELHDSLILLFYCPLLLFPFVMTGLLARLKRNTVQGLLFISALFGFTLMGISATEVIPPLPFVFYSPELGLGLGFIMLMGGMGLLGLSSLRSTSGAPTIMGLMLLLFSTSIFWLFLFHRQVEASLLLGIVHGGAFVILGIWTSFKPLVKDKSMIPKWGINVSLPSAFIVMTAACINITMPTYIARNHVEGLTQKSLPTHLDNLRYENKPLIGVNDWISFEASPEEVYLWLDKRVLCLSPELQHKGGTTYLDKASGREIDFWEGKKLPQTYMAGSCTLSEPYLYLLVDQSLDSKWKVYIHVWDD